jgi:predicted anti-sigma-YlaC factor YlaD
MDEQNEKSACREFEALLEDSLAGQLEGPAGERLSLHLSSCDACRKALQAAGAGGRLIQFARQPVEEPGTVFTRRVMAAIREEEARRSLAWNFWRPVEVLALRLSLTAGLALALLLGYGMMYSRISAPADVEIASQPGNHDLFPEPMQRPITHDEVLMNIADQSHGK